MAEANELITWLGFKFKPDAKKNIDAAKKSIDMIKSGVKKIGTFFLGASGAIGYFTNDVMKNAQQMDDLSKQMGISMEKLQQWKYVAEASGQSFEGLIGDLQKFKKTGIDAISLSDKLAAMSPKIALQWKDRLGLSDDMFNVLRQGSEKVKELMGEAYIIPEDSIKKTAEFNRQFQAVRTNLIAMKNEIFMAVAPTLVDLTRKFTNWMQVNKEWIKQKLVNVIEGIALGFKRFTDIAGTAFDYLVKIGKAMGLIGENSPEVESVAKVITGVLLIWAGGKVLGGLKILFSLLKGIFGLFGAIKGIALGATIASWGGAIVGFAKAISAKCLVALGGLKTTLVGLMGTGFSGTISSWAGSIAMLIGKVTALALELKVLWDEAKVFKEFYDKGVEESLYGWEKDIKEGKDVGWLKRFAVWYGNIIGDEIDWVYKKTHDQVVVPSVPKVANNTTSTTNSNNTIYVQMPYEQAVRYTRDVTGREPMMSVAPGGFGGNVQ